jgi:geranylgeranylglycerol-phosphate geranylgeranyltransferase
LRNKIIGFIALQRLAGIVVLPLPLVIATAALAGMRLDDPRFPVGIITVWLLVASNSVVNGVVDAERDKLKWPLRPLTTGLISKTEATLYSFILAGSAFAILLAVFNWLSAAIVFFIFIFGYIYARYTRDGIGYLTVIVPVALIPLAVWAAFSPETLLTPVPWLLVALMAAYAIAINVANEATDRVPVKALFVPLRSFTETVLYVAAVIIALFIGILIIFYAQVSWLYVVVLTAVTACALTAAKYLWGQRSPEVVKKSFKIITISMAVSLFSLAVFALIK